MSEYTTATLTCATCGQKFTGQHVCPRPGFTNSLLIENADLRTALARKEAALADAVETLKVYADFCDTCGKHKDEICFCAKGFNSGAAECLARIQEEKDATS